MIQRPQSIYFLAVVAIALMLILGNVVIYTAQSTKTQEIYSVEYDETEIIANDGKAKEPNTWLVAFAAAIAVLAGIAIFMFKKRKLQLLLGSFNYLFILGLIVMMYMYTIQMDYFDGDSNSGFTFYAGMPLALIVLNYMALKGVTKDEKLVRSMDRLR